MSNTYSSISSILTMLERKYTEADLVQALADLTAMYEEGNITEYQYNNIKSLINSKLRRIK